ncbi:MAG: DUF4783 domain-containing protein [Rhodothermales bacterium]|nr:DUF4783 domain-containing protein [Rhodothermales bacterium]
MPLRVLRLLALLTVVPATALTVAIRPAVAQTTVSPFAAFSSAMQRGDADALAQGLADRVLVSLDGDSRVYSREQARHVFARFFRDHPADRFALDYPRETGGEALFASGRYVSDGETYVVRVLMSGTARRTLREVRIERGRLE